MNRMKQISGISLAIMLLVTVGAANNALAFDYLEITVVNPHVVAGRPAVTVETDFSVNVRAVNADGSTDVNADFIHAQLISPDVAAVLPSSRYLSGGEFQFDNVRFLADGQPVRLRVIDADDGSVPAADVAINCYNYVHHFDLGIPSGDKFVDQAINVTVTARDLNGVAVLNFRDDLTFTALVGHFPSGPTAMLSGGTFNLGVATVPVTFWGTDPITRENVLTATNSVVYPGQATAAQGVATVTPLRPGPLDGVVLLLPGESLTPGVSPGKSGEPSAQSSGQSFGGIAVYATDQHWNPIEGNGLPSLSWASDDPNGTVVLPAGGVMGGNPESSLNATLIRSGTTRVTVTASGAVNGTSRSDVIINPQGLDHFEFDTGVWNPSDPQVTTIPFNIRIIARDAANNIFPLNGTVSLRASIGAADESADYILTNNSTFVDGRLDALVQVTKRGFSAYLVVDAGVVGTSPAFQVNAGPCEKILMSFPGETWVNGLNDENFSGNQGTPNAVTAGDVIDRHGNPPGRPLQQPGARQPQRDLQLPVGLVRAAGLSRQRDDHQQRHRAPGSSCVRPTRSSTCRPSPAVSTPTTPVPSRCLRTPTPAWSSRPRAKRSTRESSIPSRMTARSARPRCRMPVCRSTCGSSRPTPTGIRSATWTPPCR